MGLLRDHKKIASSLTTINIYCCLPLFFANGIRGRNPQHESGLSHPEGSAELNSSFPEEKKPF